VETPADNALERAAESLERGDFRSAVPQFRTYLLTFPEATVVRFQLAELLYRLNQPHDARTEFELCVEEYAKPETPSPQSVQCHTRLMTLAEDRGDDFAENFHRGIGLFQLVKRWDADAERRDEVAAEQTLSRALDAFTAAAALRPGETEVALYRSRVLERLGLPGGGSRFLAR